MSKPRIKPLTLWEVEHIAHDLAKKLMKYNEPIPDFSTRYPHQLESCLTTPFLQFERQVAYPGLVGKAAMLFYLMVKNHPFQNGNKRVAVTTLMVFLLKNGKWLSIANQNLYLLAKWVAESPPIGRTETTSVIRRTLEKFLIDAPLELREE